jgi:hypothetical protein
MARRYRRHKLRAHDLGINRHNKGVAHEEKAARLAREHHASADLSGKRKARKRQG